ncbi:hypothetical protein [Nocardia sp. CNY236]|uniref:hypothetical protein n=1 Tax=Nocardia sp. CNY236 TaxID=1169152 RepID=UPI0012DE7758|nr:hypothetical protein [Nocardia sp. CNY236]
MAAELLGAGDVIIGVVETGHDRTPVQDHPVVLGVLESGAQGLRGDRGVDRFDTFVVDAGVGDQQRQPDIGETVEDRAVLGLDPPARDHQDMVGDALVIEQPQHVQCVRSDGR